MNSYTLIKNLFQKNHRSKQLISGGAIIFLPSIALLTIDTTLQGDNTSQITSCDGVSEDKQRNDKVSIHNNKNNNIVKDSKVNNGLYDKGKDWVVNSPLHFLNDIIFNNNDNIDKTKNIDEQNEKNFDRSIFTSLFTQDDHGSTTIEDSSSEMNKNSSFTFSSMATTFSSLLSGEVSDKAFRELINHARNRTEAGLAGEESRSLIEVIDVFMTDLEKVKDSLLRNFDDLRYSDIDILNNPTCVFYYLEHEDEKKNPSWKRRMHRFCQGVDVNQVNYLNDALKAADLSYEDSIEKIRNGLESGRIGNEKFELIYCQMDSYPGKPSHYLAVKRGQSIWSNDLEILMVIRGTKSIPDILSDALLDDIDYRGGKAHAGIVACGKYLVDRHSKMMESLLQVSKKKKIKLTIVGHSLGAGAGTIAGMEFRSNPKYDVSVVGFGCPALLSKELSESTSSYVTTVIGDSDIVPRMSAATIGNALLNISEYDWTSKARRDIHQAFKEVILSKASFLFSNETEKSIVNAIDKKLHDIIQVQIKDQTVKRMDPILYPPGKCIHFYRDGIGISGALTPATFFNEIEISRTMLDDHLITGYRRIFLDVMRRYHNDDHFSFEQNVK